MGDRAPGNGRGEQSGDPGDGQRATPVDRVRDQLGDAGRDAKERIDDLRERFDPQIQRVTTLTERTLAFFPVRVWRRFLAQNGFILSAGMSYQALFAVFAAVYVIFAVAGIWLTGNEDAMKAFVALVNTYAPGLIGSDGVISEQELQGVATASTSLFGLTGAVALGGLIWTAISWITYARMAVRSMFGLPKDMRNYVLLKTRDFLAGFAFGAVLLLAAVLSIATTSFLDWLVGVLGWSIDSAWTSAAVQFGALLVVFVIDTLALAVMFRFLSNAALAWRRMWVGSLLGSLGLSVLQIFGGLLLSGAGKNPLLATFAVFIGLLLWFRLTSIVILVAAAWIAVEAADANESLRKLTPEQREAERRRREQEALLVAAKVRVRMSREELDAANWVMRPLAKRRLTQAEAELERLEAEQTKRPGASRPTSRSAANGRKPGRD
ncbi:YihY/virulence factor BrkB family protein [Agromyces aerolatus]|uniref:YihY/virulence factor BrkB family protein n=1 Tax=Agromyces sp. LY-1074 TaxID=3074080 RepID=UPI0028678F57|nr:MULTISPECIES: YihY/virulence factor BrkB family protein [unclassified Agromyces]MDR5700317.1 YihY/virulence factor BrkB family protein [Agromyces sp. LY-1074]MDR5706705.1 YihY/virulence factor BrkB family protein [Agromyces sp. LY-1358]